MPPGRRSATGRRGPVPDAFRGHEEWYWKIYDQYDDPIQRREALDALSKVFARASLSTPTDVDPEALSQYMAGQQDFGYRVPGTYEGSVAGRSILDILEPQELSMLSEQAIQQGMMIPFREQVPQEYETGEGSWAVLGGFNPKSNKISTILDPKTAAHEFAHAWQPELSEIWGGGPITAQNPASPFGNLLDTLTGIGHGSQITVGGADVGNLPRGLQLGDMFTAALTDAQRAELEAGYDPSRWGTNEYFATLVEKYYNHPWDIPANLQPYVAPYFKPGAFDVPPPMSPLAQTMTASSLPPTPQMGAGAAQLRPVSTNVPGISAQAIPFIAPGIKRHSPRKVGRKYVR